MPKNRYSSANFLPKVPITSSRQGHGTVNNEYIPNVPSIDQKWARPSRRTTSSTTSHATLDSEHIKVHDFGVESIKSESIDTKSIRDNVELQDVVTSTSNSLHRNHGIIVVEGESQQYQNNRIANQKTISPQNQRQKYSSRGYIERSHDTKLYNPGQGREITLPKQRRDSGTHLKQNNQINPPPLPTNRMASTTITTTTTARETRSHEHSNESLIMRQSSRNQQRRSTIYLIDDSFNGNLSTPTLPITTKVSVDSMYHDFIKESSQMDPDEYKITTPDAEQYPISSIPEQGDDAHSVVEVNDNKEPLTNFLKSTSNPKPRRSKSFPTRLNPVISNDEDFNDFIAKSRRNMTAQVEPTSSKGTIPPATEASYTEGETGPVQPFYHTSRPLTPPLTPTSPCISTISAATTTRISASRSPNPFKKSSSQGSKFRNLYRIGLPPAKFISPWNGFVTAISGNYQKKSMLRKSEDSDLSSVSSTTLSDDQITVLPSLKALVVPDDQITILPSLKALAIPDDDLNQNSGSITTTSLPEKSYESNPTQPISEGSSSLTKEEDIQSPILLTQSPAVTEPTLDTTDGKSFTTSIVSSPPPPTTTIQTESQKNLAHLTDLSLIDATPPPIPISRSKPTPRLLYPAPWLQQEEEAHQKETQQQQQQKQHRHRQAKRSTSFSTSLFHRKSIDSDSSSSSSNFLGEYGYKRDLGFAASEARITGIDLMNSPSHSSSNSRSSTSRHNNNNNNINNYNISRGGSATPAETRYHQGWTDEYPDLLQQEKNKSNMMMRKKKKKKMTDKNMGLRTGLRRALGRTQT